MSLPAQCVVDASVAMKLFVEEEHSDRAALVFADPSVSLHVPDLFFIECANVLWKKVRRNEYNRDDAREGLIELSSMDLTIAPTVELAVGALEIAADHDISAYDACYVSLAATLGAPLLTADDRLADKLGGNFEMVLLSAV